MVGQIRRDRIRKIYTKVELKMKEIQNQIEIRRLIWFGYVKRMHEHRNLNSLLKMNMSEKRPRGRPHTQWLDHVKRDVEERARLEDSS
jgi:hypothetical protein